MPKPQKKSVEDIEDVELEDIDLEKALDLDDGDGDNNDLNFLEHVVPPVPEPKHSPETQKAKNNMETNAEVLVNQARNNINGLNSLGQQLVTPQRYIPTDEQQQKAGGLTDYSALESSKIRIAKDISKFGAKFEGKNSEADKLRQRLSVRINMPVKIALAKFLMDFNAMAKLSPSSKDCGDSVSFAIASLLKENGFWSNVEGFFVNPDYYLCKALFFTNLKGWGYKFVDLKDYEHFDIYLMQVNGNNLPNNLPDLAQRNVDLLPVLVKAGARIFIYGKKNNGQGWIELNAAKIGNIQFPTIGQPEIKLSKDSILALLPGVDIYEEIRLKNGHDPYPSIDNTTSSVVEKYCDDKKLTRL